MPIALLPEDRVDLSQRERDRIRVLQSFLEGQRG
jgi:hypothetical protein